MPTGQTLVTGAAGFAGSHLLDLLTPDVSVIGWYRPDGPPPPARAHVDWHAVELTSRADVDAAIRRALPSHLYHLAGAPSVESSWRNSVPHLEINALGTHHLLEAVRVHAPGCRVLVVTSAQVYAAADAPLAEDAPLVPSSPYGFTKLAQDQLALRAGRNDGLTVLVARPFNHIGPRQSPDFALANFARQIARIEAGLAPAVLRVGHLDARRDMLDVRDVARAYRDLMDRGRAGVPYNVCAGVVWRMRDLLDRLCNLSAAPVVIETDPDRLRPHDVPILQGDGSRVLEETGWAPRIPIGQTLQDTLDWWRGQERAGG